MQWILNPGFLLLATLLRRRSLSFENLTFTLPFCYIFLSGILTSFFAERTSFFVEANSIFSIFSTMDHKFGTI